MFRSTDDMIRLFALLVPLILVMLILFRSPRSKHRESELASRPYAVEGVIAHKFLDTMNWGIPTLIIEIDTLAKGFDPQEKVYKKRRQLKRFPDYFSEGLQSNNPHGYFTVLNGFYCGLYKLWEKAEVGDKLSKVQHSLEYQLISSDTSYFYPDCVTPKEIGRTVNPRFKK